MLKDADLNKFLRLMIMSAAFASREYCVCAGASVRVSGWDVGFEERGLGDWGKGYGVGLGSVLVLGFRVQSDCLVVHRQAKTRMNRTKTRTCSSCCLRLSLSC